MRTGMLAAAAMVAAIGTCAEGGPKLARPGPAHANAERIERALDLAAQSPASIPMARRRCLARAAGRTLGLADPVGAVLPGAPEDLAFGRAGLYQGLAQRLRALCPEAPGAARPKACGRPGPPLPPPPAVIPIDQTEQGFILWQRVQPERARQAARFRAYLMRQKLMSVAPFYQILRTASDWKTCGGEPFAAPPAEDWPRAAKTLDWIARRVKPAIGPVEVVSGFRDADLNACAQGARESAHLGFWALDLEPVDPTLDRPRLMERLCVLHARYGRESDIGLGFYAGVRFHVDDKRFRHWGFDPVAAPACAVGAAPPSDAPGESASAPHP